MSLEVVPSHPLLVNLSFLLAEATGISIYAANIFPYLTSLEPTLLTSHSYPHFNCYSIPPNLTPAQGRKGHFDRLGWTQFQLPKIYQKLQAELLFSPVPEAPLFSRCRSVVMLHDLIPLRFPKWTSPLMPYFHFYIPAVLRQAEHILCNSQATADDAINFLGIPARKITPILLGYDQQHFRPLELSSKVKTSSLPYFLYLGRHDPHKNVSRLITAFSQLASPQDYQLWLAGPCDRRYTPKLLAQAQELGIEQQVKCLDYVPYQQLPILLNQALGMVFPSLWEGFGFPVLEAMACGTPVITSNLSSLPEVAGEAALLVNPYNIQELAQTMQQLCDDPDLRSQLRQRGLERAKTFSWQKTGQATVAVLRQLR